MSELEKPIKEIESSAVKGGEPVAAEEPEHTLKEMSAELRYFTPALIITHGRFDRDPLYEFNNRHWNPDPNLRPFAIDLPRPVFQHLGITLLGRFETGCQERVNWNHRLYAIHHSRFEELQKFVCSISFTDPFSKRFVTTGAHVLEIVDVTSLGVMAAADELPTIHVTVFCISTNYEFVYMHPAIDPPRTRAYAINKPPSPEVILQAQAVFGPPPDPSKAFKT